jgi:hypothetical protein
MKEEERKRNLKDGEREGGKANEKEKLTEIVKEEEGKVN